MSVVDVGKCSLPALFCDVSRPSDSKSFKHMRSMDRRQFHHLNCFPRTYWIIFREISIYSNDWDCGLAHVRTENYAVLIAQIGFEKSVHYVVIGQMESSIQTNGNNYFNYIIAKTIPRCIDEH